MILFFLMVVPIYNGEKEVISERRLIIMGDSGQLSAPKKENHGMRNEG